jgi:hypothetical protein
MKTAIDLIGMTMILLLGIIVILGMGIVIAFECRQINRLRQPEFPQATQNYWEYPPRWERRELTRR